MGFKDKTNGLNVLVAHVNYKLSSNGKKIPHSLCLFLILQIVQLIRQISYIYKLIINNQISKIVIGISFLN
jgi:hypothetical protein